jgi:D-alanyl-D-alanine dipeptidase
MKRFAAAGSFFVLLILAMPTQTHAAIKPTFLGPIVPKECHCDNQVDPRGGTFTTAPDFGCVAQTFQNTVNFGVTFGTILFSIYIVIAGFAFILSGGSPESRSKAKTRLTNVIIGIVVVLLAWLVVDYVMKTLYDPATAFESGSFGPWNSILVGKANNSDRCIVSHNPDALSNTVAVLTQITPGTASGPAAGGGNNCTAIPASQLTTVDGYQVTIDTGKRFLAMKAAAAKDGIPLVITSGYRSPEHQLEVWNEKGCHVLSNGKTQCNSTTAAVPCSLGGNGSNHTRGTAVDIKLTSGVYAWLKQHGSQYGFYNSLSNDLPHWSDTGR